MPAQVVSFHCVLKNALGQVISTSFNKDVITQLDTSAPLELPGLAAGLKEVRTGERRKISLKAGDAYGLYDPALAREATRKSISSNGELSLGDRVHLADSFGDFRLFRITKIFGDLIYLDANHPLAGQDLEFDIHVVDARDATAEEILESSKPALPNHIQ